MSSKAEQARRDLEELRTAKRKDPIKTTVSQRIAQCIGCGCTDDNACETEFGDPCSWSRVDYLIGLGVCSECSGHEARWEAGDRSLWLGDPDFEDGEELILPGDEAYDETLAHLPHRRPM